MKIGIIAPGPRLAGGGQTNAHGCLLQRREGVLAGHPTFRASPEVTIDRRPLQRRNK